jgi:ketosteroid isomerase-like protein
VAQSDLDDAIEQSHAALAAILTGDATLYHALYSGAEDVTLGNPFGPFVRGRKQVEETTRAASLNYRDGVVTGVELIAKHVSGDIGCVVEIERGRAKVGGSADAVRVTLRVTSVFRRETGDWKLVHRPADPIATPRPAASVIRRP